MRDGRDVRAVVASAPSYRVATNTALVRLAVVPLSAELRIAGALLLYAD